MFGRRTLRSLLLAFLSTVAAAGCCGAGVSFPPARRCNSPDFQWTIRCVTEEGLHKLFLSRLAASKEDFIYATGRSCDVLWSDDSERIAVTDWVGSNGTEIVLVNVSDPGNGVSLQVKDLAKFVLNEELEGHCYFEALKWENAQRLLIRVFGHTDENPSHGFAYYFSVDTTSGVPRLVKKVNAEPSMPRHYPP